jgi:oxygen-independent coproporphyrinogen-3 oxidase
MTQAGFGIYVHWPFCLSKCPYCDFNSHVSQTIDQDRWRRALLTELAWFAERAGRQTVTSIFFGGGTPSLMDPETAAAIIDAVAGHFPVAADVEITLEANPSTVETDRFRDFRAAGIARLSLGVQALDDASLRFLGRHHDAAEALAALDTAGRLFPRTSFDLIYARPGQTPDGWRAELTRALTLAGEHLSLYQLTIEEGTAFAPAHARGDFILPDEDAAAEMFEITGAVTAAAGLPAYEISNHARPGAACRHNLTYWRGGDYVGIGPGAHGRLGAHRLRQHRAPESWLAGVDRDGHATRQSDTLGDADRARELIMTGLRLTDGIDTETIPAICGLPLDRVIEPDGLARMIEGGFVVRDESGLRTTPRGRLLLNSVLSALLAE